MGDLPPAVSDELLARAFWPSYTGSDLRLAPPPISQADPAGTAADQARIRTLHPAAAATLLAAQAVLEARGLAGSTGPLLWSPAGSDPAQEGRALLEPRPVPPGVEPDWDGWEHQVALAAVLEAAEEDLTEHAFQHWLWRWLAINYGIPDTIPDTDNTRHWPPAVWTLRAALLNPDTDPDSIGHPDLPRALRHSTRTSHGRTERWRLLRASAAGQWEVLRGAARPGGALVPEAQ